MAAPRAEGRWLLLAVLLCVCCSPVTCKKNKTPWLERILQDMAARYNGYAKMEGDPKTMTCKEFGDYLKADMPQFLEGKGPDIVEQTLASMDEDKNGELDYKEFFQFQTHYIIAKYNANNQLRS